MQALSQRNGRHVSPAQAGDALQNPAYRLADALKRFRVDFRFTSRKRVLIDQNEGFGANAPDPSPIRPPPFALRAPYLGINAGAWTGSGPGETVLNRYSRCIHVMAVLAAVATTVAGCADSRMSNAGSNSAAGAQASGEAPYHTAYGIASDGPTTDLYTELFGSSRRDNANATAPASMSPAVAQQQLQPVTAPAASQPQPVQPATASAATRQGQRTTASATGRQVQPAPAPAPAPAPVATQVVQQPAPPQPPPEPDTPSAYGITSNGPTTDLYTELFGPRRRDGQ